MTPEEIAEKVAIEIQCDTVFVVRTISEAIAKAVEDAVHEAIEGIGNPFAANPDEWFCKSCLPLKDACVKQAIEEAREEAGEEIYEKFKVDRLIDCDLKPEGWDSVDASYKAWRKAKGETVK